MTAAGDPTTPAVSRRRPVGEVISRLGLTIFLVVLAIAFSVIAPHFATANNVFIILSAIAVIGIVSIGQTKVIVSGGFDLSTSGVVPLGSIVFALFLNSGIPVGVAVVLAVLIGVLVGFINGIVITKLKINPLITTLGMLSITAGTAASIANGVSIPFTDPVGNVLGDNYVGNIANVVWIFLVLVVIGILVMRYTVFGRSLYAMGGNRDAGWLAGLKVDRITITVYILSAALSAFAGTVLASQLYTGSTTVGIDSALSSIAAVVLGGGSLSGGVGTVGGTVIGVLVLGVFKNGLALMHVSPFYQQIATGVILLLAVAVSQFRQSSQRPRIPGTSRTPVQPNPSGLPESATTPPVTKTKRGQQS